MKKQTQKQIKSLKSIRPDREWKDDLKMSILGSKEPFYKFPLFDLQRAFGSVALAGAVMLTITFGANYYFFQMNQNNFVKLNPDLPVMADRIRAENERRENKEFLKSFVMETEIENLSKNQKVDLAKESTQAILKEIEEVEERMSRVLATK